MPWAFQVRVLVLFTVRLFIDGAVVKVFAGMVNALPLVLPVVPKIKFAAEPKVIVPICEVPFLAINVFALCSVKVLFPTLKTPLVNVKAVVPAAVPKLKLLLVFTVIPIPSIFKLE